MSGIKNEPGVVLAGGKSDSAVVPVDEGRDREVVTMRQLLECGVHFGHQTKRWNPSMKKYIFTSRNGIHIIDLQQSIKLIHEAYDFVKKVVSKKGKVLFVGTKKQVQDVVRFEAERCGMPCVYRRWLGGTLTNISTVRRGLDKLRRYERLIDEGILDRVSKKESSRIQRFVNKGRYYLSGIKDLLICPDVVFVVDTKRELLAVNEAVRLGIPVIGIVDTNADPGQIRYPVPGNDDAIRSVKLLASIIANACLDGQGRGDECEYHGIVGDDTPSVDVSSEVDPS